MRPHVMEAFTDEFEKIAVSGAVKGLAAGAALAGGLGVARGVSREADLRMQEAGRFSEEDQKTLRKARTKHHAAGVGSAIAGGALVGGAAGHWGPRASAAVGKDMKDGVYSAMTEGGKKAWSDISPQAEEFAARVSKNGLSQAEGLVSKTPGILADSAKKSAKGWLKREFTTTPTFKKLVQRIRK